MSMLSTEKFLARLVGFTGAFTTIFLISGSVTDPVNTPKMFALGVLSTASLSIILGTKMRNRVSEYRLAVVFLAIFFLALISSTLFSDAPLTQNLYGSYGRNNGLLTYLFLGFALLSTLSIRSLSNFGVIVKALFMAGIVNLAYCLWVIVFGDFVGWFNPYRGILGTLGNPNFIGAFLGIIFSALIAVIVNSRASIQLRILSAAAIPVCSIEIIKSNAVQGRVVAAVGSAVVIFLFLRAKFGIAIQGIYIAGCTLVGSFALAGALQLGPLTDYIYKTSVSLRGQYWLAGWNTGSLHPFTGVGMDSFGDWYRRMRDVRAIELPGVNTVVNASHNVPIDMFAFGGWPLFISYLLIVLTAGLAILKVVRRTKLYDFNFAVLSSAWVGYQLQSIISINQIGLAVWGWILSGAVIAYEKVTRDSQASRVDNSELRSNGKSKEQLPPQVPLMGLLGAFLGLLIALPPLAGDAKWRSAQLARSVQALESSMAVSYFNPPNPTKFLSNVQAFEQNNFNELAHKYTLEAIKWNPNVFDSWRTLYFIKQATPDEKKLAVENMKRLDPLNPDVTSAQ